MKPRVPPLWTGQNFDMWKHEVTAWHENDRGSDEGKFLDLMESLKKNVKIQWFVNGTLIEKVGETRTVNRILEIMSEKFDKNTGEKTLEVMRKISGEGFKPDESVEKMIDRFGEMMVEIEKIKLADNLNYAMGLQFLERLEKTGKVSNIERKLLRDIL